MSLPLDKLKNKDDLSRLQSILKSNREAEECYIAVCGGTGCHSSGSEKVREALLKSLEKNDPEGKIKLRFTGCQGLCERGPLVVVFPQEIFYQRVSVDDAEEIITKTVKNGEILERLLYTDPVSERKFVYAREIPFLQKQKRILLENNWLIEPGNILDYLSLGGYNALARALSEMTGEQIIDEIDYALLRGRGGAGFPTSKKWKECHDQTADYKYIICNADEGDPGAFMDRSLLEGNPHLVLEGLIIGGYAVGAREGIIYVRAEYPIAVSNIKKAIGQAEKLGLLGENILGSGFDFHVSVVTGAGAFVCGETSALVEAVYGRVGEPRQKPPHLAERGYMNKPTVINNVESLANVTVIIRFGADRYRTVGTEKSKGTKIFSLVGKVNNTGLVEVPLGMTLREIIFDLGGGVQNGKAFKAVQTGGPSGGCLPEYLLDSPTDFEELAAAGSMMGSGGMIVMDEDTCMVDIARYFLKFLSDESCGCCFSCREGISRMLEMIEDITKGESSLGQLELLQELAHVIKDSTMCGLGQTSVNPVLSTIRFFEDEYRAHILEKRCPAGVCRDLISFHINEDLCTGCGVCLKKCPEEAIQGVKKEPHAILREKCSRCGICLEACKFGAIVKS